MEMQTGIKILLMDARDYNILTESLEPLFIKENTYCDYFFDFENKHLAETGTVLRLRVPAEKPYSSVSPILCGTDFSHDPNEDAVEHPAPAPATMTGDSSCEYFLSSCEGPDPIRQQMQIQEQQRAVACGVGSAAVGAVPATSMHDPLRHDLSAVEASELNPDPVDKGGMGLIPGACGILALKQRNMVEDGHQQPYFIEDANVPPDVVKDLVSKGEDDGHVTRVFYILERYAARRQHEFMQQHSEIQQTSSGSDKNKAPIQQIVERLRDLSNQIQKNLSQVEASCVDSDDNLYFSRVRSSAGTQLQPGTLVEEQVSDFVPYELVHMGHYISTRRIYRYLQDVSSSESYTGTGDLFGDGVSTCDSTNAEAQSLCDHLNIRIDKTFYPFGEKYELEVSGIRGMLEEEILTEVKTLLEKLKVKFHLGSEGKYARFTRETENECSQSQNVQDVKLCLSSLSGYEEVEKNLREFRMPAEGNDPVAAEAFENLGIEGTRKRHRSCHDLLPNAMAPPDDDADSPSASELTEYQQNYFFDGLKYELQRQKCFLRLRCYNRAARYTLVLKENQSFKDGQQRSSTNRVELSKDAGQAMIQDPTRFMLTERAHNPIAMRLWGYFGLRALHKTVQFDTERITVPWLSARSQSASPTSRAATKNLLLRLSNGTASSQRVPAGRLLEDSVARLSQRAARGFDSALGTRPRHEDEAAVGALYIHLDRTQYPLPVRQREAQQRPSWGLANAQATFTHPSSDGQNKECRELYEIEVTNILPQTSPSAVFEELTRILNGMNVEWRTGIQSKLDQYYSLMSITEASPSSKE